MPREFYGLGAPVEGVEIQAVDDVVVVQRGSSWIFRPYLSHRPPPGFTMETNVNVERIGAAHNRIGTAIEIGKKNLSVTLARGMAAEQLTGIVLSYLHPRSIIYPQYCLDVRPGHFTGRIDYFFVDDQKHVHLVEVKYGNALGNITETINYHHTLLKNNGNNRSWRDYSYHLITFINPPPDFPFIHEKFNDVVQNLNGKAAILSISTLAQVIKSFDPKKGDPWAKEFLDDFRDYFYNLLDRANQLTGDSRIEYLDNSLGSLYSIWLQDRRDGLQKFFAGNRDDRAVSYNPFEAIYQVGDTFYSGYIEPRTYEEEIAQRIMLRRCFDGMPFASSLSRDFAVMLEMSPFGFHFQKCFIRSGKKVSHAPIFDLGEDLPGQLRFRYIIPVPQPTIHQNTQQTLVLTDLTQVMDPHVLAVSEEDFNFARAYIDYWDRRNVSC